MIIFGLGGGGENNQFRQRNTISARNDKTLFLLLSLKHFFFCFPRYCSRYYSNRECKVYTCQEHGFSSKRLTNVFLILFNNVRRRYNGGILSRSLIIAREWFTSWRYQSITIRMLRKARRWWWSSSSCPFIPSTILLYNPNALFTRSPVPDNDNKNGIMQYYFIRLARWSEDENVTNDRVHHVTIYFIIMWTGGQYCFSVLLLLFFVIIILYRGAGHHRPPRIIKSTTGRDDFFFFSNVLISIFGPLRVS